MGRVLKLPEQPIENARMLIDGEWVDGAARIEVRNPARPDELVGTVVRGTPDDVDRAVAAAKAAFAGWARRSYAERAAILAEALGRLERNIDERATLFVRENGKTLSEAKAELAGVPERQRLTLGFAEELDRDSELKAPQGRSFITHRPFGVVVSIVPWNGPNSLAFGQITAAMLAGNTVVLKPPETCPLTLIQGVAMMADVLPPGALNVVTGMPSEIGDALTAHPDVGKIGFTGSIASARRIMANASQTVKALTFELGGNDPAILLEDADLSEETIDRMTRVVFRMAGQVCMAIKRIYVPETIKDRFLDAFTASVDKIIVGDGLEPKVVMGPLHTEKALIRARGLVADAERRGAQVMRVGKIDDADTFSRGYFMQPTIVTDIDGGAPLMAEEQFCPAVPVTTYADVDDAIRRANDTVYGLSGSVWSKDVERALELIRRLEAGTVWVNTHGTGAINRDAPYGGVKQSGFGRKGGLEGVKEYMQSQTITTYERDGD